MGRGFPVLTSTNQNLNNQNSIEADIVGEDDCILAVCWTWYFLETQYYNVTENIVYQDNQVVILIVKNGKALCSKKKYDYSLSHIV